MMKKLFQKLWQKQEFPLPSVTLPYDEKIKIQQRNFLLTFLIFLGFSGFYSYFYVQQKIEAEQLVRVFAFAKETNALKAIEKIDTKIIQIPRKNIPQGAFSDFEMVSGKILIHDGVENEIILPHHFQDDINPKSISAKFETLFAFSMDENWFVSSLPAIYENDKIDVLVSNPKQGIAKTVSIATNLKVISVQKGKHGKKVITINCTENEAQTILFSRGLRLPMQILVRSSRGKKGDEEEVKNISSP